ncbi:ATP-binding protein [Streptomyces sp. AF1A]|uniref:ATP-binding protein n=1 Tax=Streptomyces sp. AF1A TaxID=3394350 RepID=UPI0039BD046A
MRPTTGPIRVLVADDHPVVRRGMAALLASLDGVEVVAEAATGEEALRVRRRVTQLRAADGRPLDLTIDAPVRLPPLPAAVEVAAYRVAVEAVTNIARHSDGATVRLTLALRDAGSLTVTVADTGRCTEPWTPGVGIQSMHERVEQIGGTLTLRTTPQGATVTADLPPAIPA